MKKQFGCIDKITKEESQNELVEIAKENNFDIDQICR